MTAKQFVVLASTDETHYDWRLYGPVAAASGDAAIEKVRDGNDDLVADLEAEFIAFTMAKWEPSKMHKQVIEKWALTKVKDIGPEDAQATMKMPAVKS